MPKVSINAKVGELDKGEYDYVEDGENYIILVPDGDGHRAFSIPKSHPAVSTNMPRKNKIEYLNTTKESDV